MFESDFFSLKNSGAFVTGSESGLGHAIAMAFLKAGAKVVGADISNTKKTLSEREDRCRDQNYFPIYLDVADVDSTIQAVQQAHLLLERIDICVNCAGIPGRAKAVEYPHELWEKVIRTNLTGAFLVSQAIGSAMVEQGRGSIINIASIGGIVGYPGSVGYQASKGGIIQLTRALAIEWAPYKVRVNAIAPGHIATELVQKQWQVEPQLKDFFLSRTPLGELGTPSDVANAAVFLASDASRMITGQVLAVDGGYTAQ